MIRNRFLDRDSLLHDPDNKIERWAFDMIKFRFGFTVNNGEKSVRFYQYGKKIMGLNPIVGERWCFQTGLTDFKSLPPTKVTPNPSF